MQHERRARFDIDLKNNIWPAIVILLLLFGAFLVGRDILNTDNPSNNQDATNNAAITNN